MKTTVEILREARALIADPQRWCRGELARNADGDPVDPLSPAACQFCVEGALLRVDRDGHYRALVALRSASGGTEPWVGNDREGHAWVLDLFDRALAPAEAETTS